MSDIAKRCEDCQYYVDNPALWDYGYCHFLPPTGTNSAMVDFPSVKKQDWCGQWRDKNRENGYDILDFYRWLKTVKP